MEGASGTLTFLFSDVEASTQRWQEDRDAMAAALAEHDANVRSTIDGHGGSVFKHTGDGVCAVFESASAAVAAALDVQRVVSLPVRIGLHTGEAMARDGDYFGPTLNRCARIMDAGHGGQVLASSSTRSLVDGIEWLDLGEFLLKGVERPERVFQAGTGRFAPLRARARSAGLPVTLTTMIGRDDLLAEAIERLRRHRLVTLVGAGGVGKTRLALDVAERLAPDHDLVTFVQLTEIDDDADVLAAVTSELRLKAPTIDAVHVALADRAVLVVLDNCEHVIDGAAELAEQLVGAHPSVRVLATSREGLAVDGEALLAVPGLASDGSSSEAVALFVERAREQSVEVADDDLTVVSEICRRLDGLPLAIELAAARAGVLSPRDLLGRLDERFQVLTTSRRRRSRDRQRTLRETVDWSYDLLDDDERTAFARWSIFVASFDLDAARAVLGERTELEVLDLLGALVDKSLLTVMEVEGTARYRFLETIRSYAEERLDDRGESDELVGRLRTHLTGVVRRRVDDLISGAGSLEHLRLEIPNVRLAFDEALRRGDVEGATGLVSPMNDVAFAIPALVAGWAPELLALEGIEGTVHELDALMLRGVDAWVVEGRYDLAGPIAERIVAVAEGTPGLAAARAVSLGAVALFLLAGRRRQALDARELVTEMDPGGELTVTTELSLAPYVYGEPDWHDDRLPSDAELDTLVAANRSSSAPVRRAQAELVRALRSYRRGQYAEMLVASRRAREVAVPGAGNWFLAWQTESWALLALGDLEAAVRSADDDLDHAHRYADPSAMIIPTAIYALVAQALDDAETAAVVRGGLPRRLTLLLVRELLELDAWLAARLPADRIAELTDVGRAASRRDLQRRAHEAFRRHGLGDAVDR